MSGPATGTIRTGIAVMRRLARHESAHGRPWRPVGRFLLRQVAKRVSPAPVTVDAFGSGRLRVHADSASGNAVIYLGWPDWNEMHFLRRLLRPGDGFLDIGANIGVYSVLAATRVLPGGNVFAVEPEPTQAERLRENFGLNGLDETAVFEVAVGESAGAVEFEVGRDSLGAVTSHPSGGGHLVPLRRLDELFEASDRLVAGKIDIEGYELQAFRGAERLLVARRPRCWIVETNPLSRRYGTDRKALHAYLLEYGFDLFALEDGGVRLRRLGIDEPYPPNVLALTDLPWFVERDPTLAIVGSA